MSPSAPRLDSAEACVDFAISRVGKTIVLGLPLALGKANHIANAFYARAKADPELDLTVFTALTLEVPRAPNALAARLLEPIAGRLYAGYPELDYARDRRRNALPENVRVKEFFLPPGGLLGNAAAQRDYVSANYTHAARSILDSGLNVAAQMIAPGPDGQFSLSCNPDLSLDMIPALRAKIAAGQAGVVLGEINAGLPFMGGDAAIGEDWFDAVFDAGRYTLFPIPAEQVSDAAWAIGLFASALVKDGGTLQTGIGALSDAVAGALRLRHERNAGWERLLASLGHDTSLQDACQGRGPFEQGLYGCSEMLTLGLLDLYEAGIIKRRVVMDPDRQQALLDAPASLKPDEGIALHGGFFAGPAALYERLRGLSDEDRARIGMTGVSFVNDLFGYEAIARLQRRDARFINTAMMVNGRGAAMSDTLLDGRVVSGVGGQYNFAAMGHELEGARSIILLRATRTAKGKTASNIVWQGGAEVTVPRHLRDIVITEYGAADLRGKTDREVAIALAHITDSRFQDAFLDQAKAAGKLEAGFELPPEARQNTPEQLAVILAPAREAGLLPDYPLGSELTPQEQHLKSALEWLGARTATRKGQITTIWKALTAPSKVGAFSAELDRMGLSKPAGWRDHLARRLVAHGLRNTPKPR
ncbi:MAG: acetyl-CoA hydrolase/transferase C-terminal domain-containing protein [Glycocaulis sp.]